MIHPFWILLFIDFFLCSWFPPKPIILNAGESYTSNYDDGTITLEVIKGTGVIVSRQGCKLEDTFKDEE